MKTTVIAALSLTAAAFGLNAQNAEALPGGQDGWTATCHYVLRVNGATKSGTTSATARTSGDAVRDARSRAPRGAQVTGCSQSPFRR